MNWIFWALLVVALLLLFTPAVAVLSAAVRLTLYIIGGLLLIAALVWAVSMLTRPRATSPSAM